MLQQLIFGLQAGSWYALIALAIVLVLKSTDVPNFAMASMGVLPAYLLWTLHDGEVGWPYVLAILAALVSGVVLGLLIERVFIRPILRQSHFTTVLMTMGLLVVITSGAELIWSPRPRSIDSPITFTMDVGGQVFNGEQILTISLGLAIAIALAVFFRSPTGLEMRALAEDGITPRLLGISVSRVMSISWGMAAFIATLGVILQAQATVLSAQSATTLVMNGFVAAAIGGFASTTGAFVGGLTLGLLESLVGSQLGTESVAAVSLLVVFAILMVRPEGLFPQPRPREI